MTNRTWRFAPAASLAALALTLVAEGGSAQLVSQSELTAADVDPGFQLTLDHLADDLRWLGVPPRDITWSPDGSWVYFRWREDPTPGQHPSTDPWYAVDPQGTTVRGVDDEEASRIPGSNIQWSAARDVAAWSAGGTLYLWTADGGTRPVFVAGEGLGNLSLSADGSRIRFSTRGSSRFGDESGDLWTYDVGSGVAHQIAAVRTRDEEPGEWDAWLARQQLELVETVAKRKRDRVIADSVSRVMGPQRPQVIPVERGARAVDLSASPDGRFITSSG